VGDLLGGELLDVEAGAGETLFFSGEANEQEGMLTGRRGEHLEEAGKERSATPVVGDSISVSGMIEMSSDEDGGGCGSGQKANDVRLISAGYRLLGEICRRTARFNKELLESGLTLVVVSSIKFETLLKHAGRDRLGPLLRLRRGGEK